jgi:hypothetical protein
VSDKLATDMLATEPESKVELRRTGGGLGNAHATNVQSAPEMFVGLAPEWTATCEGARVRT